MLAELVAVLVAVCLPMGVGAQVHQGAAVLGPAQVAPDEALVAQLINDERAARGLRALVPDEVLAEVARAHSADMAARAYFAHLAPRPAPATPAERYAAALGRTPACVVGENIGRCDQPLMGVIHEHLMSSPEHRDNILDADYTRVGVGICELSDGQVWVTQMFAGNSR